MTPAVSHEPQLRDVGEYIGVIGTSEPELLPRAGVQ